MLHRDSIRPSPSLSTSAATRQAALAAVRRHLPLTSSAAARQWTRRLATGGRSYHGSPRRPPWYLSDARGAARRPVAGAAARRPAIRGPPLPLSDGIFFSGVLSLSTDLSGAAPLGFDSASRRPQH